MATLVLSAAGAALGGAVGGGILGISSAVIGKAIGASIGSVIDQKLLGSGSASVETGRVDSFRLQSAAEGTQVPRLFGTMRLSGQMIWSSRFKENKTTKKTGGKGSSTKVTSYSYSVSIALALCEGEVTKVGRVWADGNEISLSGTSWRLHKGSETQLPDPLIEAIEGAGSVPAYRGTAYIVLEDLELGPFGNRIPQFSFEITRRVKELGAAPTIDPFEAIRAVALIPGTGEFALGTTPVSYPLDKGVVRLANQNNPEGRTDIDLALSQLRADMPQVDQVSLVVSWFGDDLSCSTCTIRPKVEQKTAEGSPVAWNVSGLNRTSATLVSYTDGRPTYGGTPTDQSVIEAIQRLAVNGQQTMFYPFILMDVPSGNGKIDPWTNTVEQPVFPWRGRITLNVAPGVSGSVDKTANARGQVRSFFGNAQPADFAVNANGVSYNGPEDWGYRRFILHYAFLTVVAGGVDTFIIGSEMRGITRIRDDLGRFPAVDELVALAADVRAILGSGTKVSYAADWSEYFGYQPSDGTGDVYFNLDPLWGSNDIDFVGIDNYMPLSDWRDTSMHADAAARSIYNLDYLEANVEGGEGYDWYYASDLDRDQQTRTPIIDTAHGEDWVFRYKDLNSWWANPHFDRPNGVRASTSTAWVPQSKPIVFTEFGCPAVNKGTNQPNVFLDPKSSEGQTPYYSDGSRDDFIQYRYLQAHLMHWGNPANNPVSPTYNQPMVDMGRAYVWAWDARPWPDFPNRSNVWSDGANFERGHWISGRVGAATLAAVVSEISERSNLSAIDVRDLHGSVRGYTIQGRETARQSIQPLMLSHSFDNAEIDGAIKFSNRAGPTPSRLDESTLAVQGDDPALEFTRAPDAELSSGFQVRFYQSQNAYQIGAASAMRPAGSESTVAELELPVALSGSEAGNIAARFLSEAHIAADQVKFSLPGSYLSITVGDCVEVTSGGEPKIYRIDRIEERGERQCQASRIEHGVYISGSYSAALPIVPSLVNPGPLYVEFLDLPLITGAEVPHAPHIAVSATPWVGDAAIYSSSTNYGYQLDGQIEVASIVGTLQSDLAASKPWVWSKSGAFVVSIPSGELESATEENVLNGANLAAIRSPGGEVWEILQFASAVLVSPGTYNLSNLLRGQFGTEAFIPQVHPSGSDFVLLDSAMLQPNIPESLRGLSRHYRVGPSSRGYDDPSFQTHIEAFKGVGLRPYAPVHPRATRLMNGDIHVDWLRQTRIGGDSWEGIDAPLSEESEIYLVRASLGGQVVREFNPVTSSLTYLSADQLADGVTASIDFDIAQISQKFGPGPFRRITFND